MPEDFKSQVEEQQQELNNIDANKDKIITKDDIDNISDINDAKIKSISDSVDNLAKDLEKNKTVLGNEYDTYVEIINGFKKTVAEIKYAMLANKIDDEFPTKESRSNTSKVNAFALANNISTTVVFAYRYTEAQVTEKDYEQAKEIDNKPKNTIIKTQQDGTFYETYEQRGNLEHDKMTGIVLDFTGSMSSEQMQGILNTMIKLYTLGIITDKTKVNVMYGVVDQDKTVNGKDVADIDIAKMDDTRDKTKTVAFGPNGATLKNYLMNQVKDTKGKQVTLIDENRKITENLNGEGSTPLYSTILTNLMNPDVRETTVFTDGASDLSADTPYGAEEIGNKDAWNEMIRLCKQYDKKINIVAFNISASYLSRAKEMEKYFQEQGVGELLSIVNISEEKNGKQFTKTDELVQALSEYALGNYQNVVIKEDPNCVNKTITLDNTADEQISENYKNINLPAVDPTLPTFTYNAETATYSGNLKEVFQGIDLSNYKISYTINTSAEASQTYEYPNITNKEEVIIVDNSGSMAATVGEYFTKHKLANDPTITYKNISEIRGLILGFNKREKGDAENNELVLTTFNEGKPNSQPKLNFSNPTNNLYSLVLKKAKDYYTDLLSKDQKNETYTNKINEINVALDNMNTKYTKNMNLYNELLEVSAVKESKTEIEEICRYITNLEKMEGYGYTPIFETFSEFFDKGFTDPYKGKTLYFYTDFGENSTNKNNPVNKLFNLLRFNERDGIIEQGEQRKFSGPLFDYMNGLKRREDVSQIKQKIFEAFEKNPFGDLNVLVENLKTLNKVNFQHSKKISEKDSQYFAFMNLLKEFLNMKAGKEIVSISKVDNINSTLGIKFQKEFTSLPSQYSRNSITFNATDKNGVTISKTVGIQKGSTEEKDDNLVVAK